MNSVHVVCNFDGERFQLGSDAAFVPLGEEKESADYALSVVSGAKIQAGDLLNVIMWANLRPTFSSDFFRVSNLIALNNQLDASGKRYTCLLP